jgi:ubiquinone/menaquinone biosynthesis C-methylase UbiE
MTVSTHPLPPHADNFAVAPDIPAYLEQTYWWAYVHPRAVRLFEQEWLVNLILFGNYRRLRQRALDALGQPITGSTLQVACVYGNLTPRLIQRLSGDATLKVVDVLPIQLQNLATKLRPDSRVQLQRGDASALSDPDASHDQVLLFFLLHEQPESTRRDTLREALRVVKPGGRVVIVDYHQPRAWHPLKPLMKRVFNRLEPFAHDLWNHPLSEFLPTEVPVKVLTHSTLFGGLYQLLVLERG